MQQAPVDEPLLPDLRTVGGKPVGKPSVDLRETVKQALQRQAWYLEYQQEQGMPSLPFVGKFKFNASPQVAAADILQNWSAFGRPKARGAFFIATPVLKTACDSPER